MFNWEKIKINSSLFTFIFSKRIILSLHDKGYVQLSMGHSHPYPLPPMSEQNKRPMINERD